MHPIELLRAVARSGWSGPGEIASEAAWGLAALAEDEPAALLPACRRLLERLPGCGPLWWLAARTLVAGDPPEARRCARVIDTDDTAERLLDTAPPNARIVRRGGISEVASADIVVIEASAIGRERMVVDGGALELLDAARMLEAPVWVEAGVGRALAPRLFDALEQRLRRRTPTRVGRRRDDSLVATDGVERVVGPRRATPPHAVDTSDCPEPPELVAGW